jgi:Arc/MetJ-type ribon-helix-helix transcriptional regulator
MTIPPHLERYVRDQVQAGCFRSEDDVVCDALERHRQAKNRPQRSPASPT